MVKCTVAIVTANEREECVDICGSRGKAALSESVVLTVVLK